jgi:YVTN family beta-propeller protein
MLVACKRSTQISAISLSLLTALLLTVPSQAAPPAPFKVFNTWKLGGDGSWDYLKVDEAAHLLYIARLNRIMVVDTQTGKLVREIDGLQHAHGVALDDKGQVGYISDGGAGSVLVFDRSTFKVIATIPAGKNPDAVLFEPTQRRVFTFNGASKNATVIDASSNKVLATISMPGKPEFSVTDGTGNVFVNIEDTNQLLQIDAASMKVTATWPLAPCKAPSGLAIDIEHHRLFAVCDNTKMAIVNSQSGKLVAAAPIGEGSDAVAFDSKRGLILSSNGESGNLTILHQDSPDQYTTLQTLNTLPGARTLALNPTTGEIYTVSATLGQRPAPTKDIPNPRPPVVPNSFVVLVIGR